MAVPPNQNINNEFPSDPNRTVTPNLISFLKKGQNDMISAVNADIEKRKQAMASSTAMATGGKSRAPEERARLAANLTSGKTASLITG